MPNERIISLRSEALEVELLPQRGARLHRLRAFGHDLLRTPADLAAYEREPFFWGSFPMAPWCNRIEARPTVVEGRTITAASNFPDGTAIHGQVQALPWEVVGPADLAVTAGDDAWPWVYRAEQRLIVEGSTLRLELGLTNLSDGKMPAGLGFHPWFLRPLEARVPAERVYATNNDSAPLPVPVQDDLDLRALQPMPPDLDATWIRRRREPVVLRWPALGLRAQLRASSVGAFLCAASPSGLDAVAVEPQTHAPDGLRRRLAGEPGALASLDPGESLRLGVEIEIRRDG